MRLVQALSRLYGALLPRNIDPVMDILVTAGAYEALYVAIHGLINPGDEVIVFEPYFDSYEPITRSAGGICRFVPLQLVSITFLYTPGYPLMVEPA